MSAIVKLPGRWMISFPDGSVLKDCERRTYGFDFRGRPSGCEWLIFHGRQFDAASLKRWGAKVELQAAEGKSA